MDRPHFGSRRPGLSVVVPILDEEESIPILSGRLAAVLDRLDVEAEVILVDDGSTDGSARAIAAAHRRDPRFVGLCLSRNFGHQVAISAGLEHARGRAVVVMDGDLQDPPEAIPALLDRLRDGFDVVYAIRASRPEGPWKRLAYAAFYRLFRRSTTLDAPLDAGDFGILSRRVVDALVEMPERDRFLRGLRAWVGFRQAGIEVDRAPRAAGRPKFTLRKLVDLAVGGFVGFGDAPLRWLVAPGLAGIVGGTILAAWTAGRSMIGGGDPSAAGWVGAAVLSIGGLQLVALAVLGEYAVRILRELNGRPLYLVRRRIGAAARPGRRARRSASGPAGDMLPRSAPNP